MNLLLINNNSNCKICGDKSTGIHYGVATCDGCKGFFKRSLSKYKAYYCFNSNKHNCEINLINRNKCKSCRFKKCLSQGMSIKGIKFGRIPKLMKSINKNNNNNNNIDDDDDDDDCILIEGNLSFIN